MLIIFLAGGFGGLTNAFLVGEGLLFPYWRKGIWCPGFVGNSFIGSMAALVSWGLYGSGSGVELAKEAANSQRVEVSLTIGAIAGAVLVGIGGAKWLSNEVDKKVLKEVAVEAGEKEIPYEDCEKIRELSPKEALRFINSYPSKETNN
jgi:hypothetical protein